MAKKTTSVIHTEDSNALINAFATASANYVTGQSTVRVTDLLLNEYNGSSPELAHALSGTSDKKSNAYKSQLRSIGRWLAYESGNTNKKQARNPDNKKTQAKLKEFTAKTHPPKSASIKITGWIYYDKDARWRSLPVIGLSSNTLTSFMQHMQAGNTHAAYRDIFNAYGAGVLTLGAEDSPQVKIDFS